MFDKYIIVEDSLRNTPEGFAVDARIPYYRGLGLSMVEVDLVVDGEAVPRRDVTFTVHGNSYNSAEMDEIFDDRWAFTEAATLTVAHAEGLTPGKHVVSLRVTTRVSYMPSGAGAGLTRTLDVA